MPIQGTFLADFTPFLDAVNKAETELREFEGDANKVAASLNRMTDQFSGRKVVQDAILMAEAVERVGGAANLTEKELAQVGAKASEAAAKLTAMGKDVPENLAALARHAKEGASALDRMGVAVGTFIGNFAYDLLQRGISGIVSLGSAAFDTASQIDDLSKKMGISAEAVQGFSHAANQSGTSIDAFDKAIQALSRNLAGDPKSVVPALQFLGLELEDLRAMKPDEAILAIADAWAALPESYDKNKAGMELLGKTFFDLIPAMKDGLRETVNAADTMSNETVDRLARAEDFWQRSWDRFVIISAEGLSRVGKVFEESAKESPVGFGAALQNLARMFGLVETAAPKAGGAVAGVGAATDGVRTSAEAGARAYQEFVDEQNRLEAAAREAAEAQKKAAEELQDWAETFAAVTEAARPFQDVLAENDTQLNEWIQTLLRAGISVGDIARAYSVSTEVVEANSRALEENAAAADAISSKYEELSSLTEQYTRLLEESTLTETEQRIADINRWADHYKAKLMERNALTAESERMIDAIATERIRKLMVNEDTLNDHTIKNAAERVQIERNTLDAMLTDVTGRYTPAMIAAQQEVVAAAEAAAANVSGAWNTGMLAVAQSAQVAADTMSDAFLENGVLVIGAAKQTAEGVKQAADEVRLTWSQAMEAVRQGEGTMSGTVQAGGMTKYGPWGSAGHLGAMTKAHAAGRYFGPTLKGNLPALSAGGTVQPSQAYVVGEKGPELFVPDVAGSILPRARGPGGDALSVGGGTTIQNTFYVNGTGEQVARVVLEEINRMMRTQRKWPTA